MGRIATILIKIKDHDDCPLYRVTHLLAVNPTQVREEMGHPVLTSAALRAANMTRQMALTASPAARATSFLGMGRKR